jgi:TetR/AcrR family transcriptional regulator, transcriptional repressor for nem operon
MKKGDETRQKIVEAAAPIFNQRGYEGGSLSELMAATGLKKGGIYRHFASKEELAAEAFDYAWSVAKRIRFGDLDEKAPAVERLKQLISNFVERRSPIPGGCPVLNTAINSDDGNPVLRARVTKALRSWLTFVQSIIADGITKGEIRADADPKGVAIVIWSSLEGASIIRKLDPSSDAVRHVQQYLNAFLDKEVAACRK